MKQNLVVIADDLSGAAEIAGIGLRFGLATRLVVDSSDLGDLRAHLTVVNADTRAMPKSDSVALVGDLARQIGPESLFFKKVDSVLRGHVVGEIDAMLESESRFDHVLLAPQNPTRNRVINREGTYLVEGVPLAKTVFASDPDHPTLVSDMVERMSQARHPTCLRVNPAEPLLPGAINICAADRFETLQAWIERRTDSTMLVGAADLFTALLIAERCVKRDTVRVAELSGRRLHVCGTTTTNSRRALRAMAARLSAPVLGADAKRARESLRQHGIAIVMAPEPGGVEAEPRDVEAALGDCASELVRAGDCDLVLAEGGATSTAICRALHWNSLEVESELAPGVVVLKPEGTVRMVIKPGSYPWPTSVVAG